MILPPSKTIVERKICPISGQEFAVTDTDIAFYDKVSPIFHGKKYSIPSPTLSPDERQRRRLCFRNERSLYKRKCDKTGREIISLYSPDKSFVVYDQTIWWGDGWNAQEYGAPFDFERSFFEQFHNLSKRVPRPNSWIFSSQNSEFTTGVAWSRDCYMTNSTDYSDGALYCGYCDKNIHCVDCNGLKVGELCYECLDSEALYHCAYCQNSENCRDSQYCFGCRDCVSCFGCWNLVGKKWYFFDTACSEEQYHKKVEEYMANSALPHGHLLQKKIFSQALHTTHILHAENCIGNDIRTSKNIFNSFDIANSENISESIYVFDSRDIRDGFALGMDENCYEVCFGTGGKFSAFCDWLHDGPTFSYYCEYCVQNTTNCFGCEGLKKGSYCILNTPYSVHEYEELAGKIIDHMRSTGEWGEFFPHELSPFGYNETVAQEYFPMTELEVKNMPRFGEWISSGAPLGRGVAEGRGVAMGNGVAEGRGVAIEMGRGTKSEGISLRERYEAEDCVGSPETLGTSAIPISHRNPPAQSATPLHRGAIPTQPTSIFCSGWNWYTESPKLFEGTSITPLPIQDYDEKKVGFEIAQRNIDALLNGIIVCEVTKKPFKIIRQELAFYIENGIPIPTKHPDQRHKERMALRNPRKLFERTCAECAKEIITTYAPERPEKVVCEECYRKLVY